MENRPRLSKKTTIQILSISVDNHLTNLLQLNIIAEYPHMNLFFSKIWKPCYIQGDKKITPISYFWKNKYNQYYLNLHITYFEDGKSEFIVEFQYFLYQVSQNLDQNSQKMTTIASSVFLVLQMSWIDLMHEKCIKATSTYVCSKKTWQL